MTNSILFSFFFGQLPFLTLAIPKRACSPNNVNSYMIIDYACFQKDIEKTNVKSPKLYIVTAGSQRAESLSSTERQDV